MTDKNTLEAVVAGIYDHCHKTVEDSAMSAIQAYQDNATIDDLKLMAKRLGVVVVPVEPTEAMLYSCKDEFYWDDLKWMYKTMIKAAED